MTPLQQPILLASDTRVPQLLLICLIGGPPLPQNFFPANNDLPDRVAVGTPSWIPSGAIAIDRISSGVAHIVVPQVDGMVLHLFDAYGSPLNSCHVPLSNLQSGSQHQIPVIPLPLHARSDATYLSFADRLVVIKPNKPLEIIELPDIILSLQGSWPFSRTRLVATMKEGAILYWDDTSGRRATFATELESPVVRFTKGGWLVAASADKSQVYRTEGHRIQLEAESSGSKVPLLGILDTVNPNQFALFGEDGAVQLYQLPNKLGT
jgi:hypothetical protein